MAPKKYSGLRDNPGGPYERSHNVTNLFIPKGELVVYYQVQSKEINREY